MGSNYLSLPEIPASGIKALICKQIFVCLKNHHMRDYIFVVRHVIHIIMVIKTGNDIIVFKGNYCFCLTALVTCKAPE